MQNSGGRGSGPPSSYTSVLIINLKVVCTAKVIKKVNPASQISKLWVIASLSQNISIICVKIKHYVIKHDFLLGAMCWSCPEMTTNLWFLKLSLLKLLCWPVTTFWGSSWALQGLKGGSKMSPEHLVPVIWQKIYKRVSAVKFIYSEKATEFCEIFTLLLTGTT